MEMRVVSIGEILWDLIGGNEFLGGAPFNLCAHLALLGHNALLISAVGDDERGTKAIAQAAELGIDTRFLTQTTKAPTGISRVVLDAEGKATHQIPRPAAYDFASLSPPQLAELSRNPPEWICYGTLAQIEPAPRLLVQRLFDGNPGAKRFYDVNLRPNCWSRELVVHLMTQANAVKLNDDEAATLAELFAWPVGSLPHFCETAARQFSLELVCITRGSNGCALFRDGQYVESPGFRVRVSDTVGSGDAFSAALLHSLHEKRRLSEAAEFANRVGALVASFPGATPAWNEREALALNERIR